MNAIITGASKGLGKAIANKLAQQGYNLYLCSRNEAEIQAAADEIAHNFGVKTHCFATDLSIRQNAYAFATEVLSKFDTIDVLVNNAGKYIGGITYQEDDDVLDQQINTNLYSAYYLTKKLIPTILKTKNAHIFNICSIASKIAYPNGGSYSISKFALYGYTKVLREELKPHKVKVTAILPGAAWSDSWKGVDLPYDRLMEANDVAASVVACLTLSHAACIEEIILRPILGDL